MTSPSVSVIIPTCNRAGLLPTAIRSVLNQTFSDFELIVVDDASDDSIDDVVKVFRDERVRWIRHDRRRGGAAARNTGIRNTGAEFVAFLDDDDEWHPDKLARQMSIMKNTDADVGAAYTGYEVVDRDTGAVRSQMLPEHRGYLSSVLLEGNCVGPTSSILMRRKCFETVGMFDERLVSFQEYDLWIRLSKAYRFDYVLERLFKYHVHGTRISTNPEAIFKGLDLLLQKYGTTRIFKRTCSIRYLAIAVQFCEMGKSGRAREALRRAISLYPFDGRYYIYFLLSLLDQRTYRIIQLSKSKIMACMAGASGDEVCRS
jgi:glycosyltransferase involved in cell wall biosynthesis